MEKLNALNELMIVFFVIIVPLLFGFLLILSPPTRINSSVGYRTSRSTKNKVNWDFAQKCFGKYSIISSTVSLLFVGVLKGMFQDMGIVCFLSAVSVFSLLGLAMAIFFCERKLKETDVS